MDQVKLYDTTLRDGMQGQGMSLSAREKLRIVQALDGLGVHFIEAGFPSSNPKEVELFELLSEHPLETRDRLCVRDDSAARRRPPRKTRRCRCWSEASRRRSLSSARPGRFTSRR